MDDIADQKDIADEISAAITSPIGVSDIDDDELLNELELLEQEALDEKLVNVGATGRRELRQGRGSTWDWVALLVYTDKRVIYKHLYIRLPTQTFTVYIPIIYEVFEYIRKYI